MLKILVVEDESILAMVLCRNLKQAGYHVCQPVATGEQAVHCLTGEQPDIILMDIRLAGVLNGIEAVQQMRAFSQVPVVFMTGYPDENTREQAMQLQPAAYLIKPVELYDLEPLFRSLLQATREQT
ncbi:MAG: response regulator [Thermoflexales bacterium]|nr:response regulator [Thermoflexales bacterium]